MSDALIAAFNAAATWQDALAAIKNPEYSAILFDTEAEATYLQRLTYLPDNGGREEAIGKGVIEIRNLFGEFQTLAEVEKAVKLQIDVEYNKARFINEIDAARNDNAAQEVLDVKAALLATFDEVNKDRQDLIADWSKPEQPLAARERAAALEKQPFTVVLKTLNARLNDDDAEDFINAMVTQFVTTRGGSHYYGDGTLIPALDAAGDAVDARYAFNSALTAADVIKAIEDHGEGFLDPAVFAKFNEIPNPSGRLNAVADGIQEIKKFFGLFESDDKMEAAVQLHIETEYNKLMFIRAIDGASETTMDDAIVTWVDDLHEQRQDLIADWKSKAEPGSPLAARVAELEAENYTKILKEVHDRLGEAGFLDKLAQKLFDARPSGKYNGVYAITDAMKTAVDKIDSPVVGATQSVTTDEDNELAQDIGASDPNGDKLTYSVKETDKPQKGDVTFKDGKFVYKPKANVNGTDTFTIVVSDPDGHTVEQKVTVTIKAVNDAPFDIVLSKTKVDENALTGTSVGDLTASDIDGVGLTYKLVDDAGGRFKLETKNGVTSVVVADGVKLDYEQATFHTVKVEVKDGAGAASVETLTIDVNNDTGENVTGTVGADVLKGDAGKDVFRGGLGDDKLYGGLGNDTLYGEKGKDIFVFDTKLGTSSSDRKVNFDAVKDFSVRDDSVYLDNAIFKKLGSGTATAPKQLKKAFFTIGDKAADRNDYLVYNKKTGVLSYDADGSGKGKAVEFAQLSKNLKLTEKDFFVI